MILGAKRSSALVIRACGCPDNPVNAERGATVQTDGRVGNLVCILPNGYEYVVKFCTRCGG